MVGDQTQDRICNIQWVDVKVVGIFFNTIFQLEDDYLCDLKDARKFGELDPRDEIEKL